METAFTALKAYCEQEAYKGWDPYDGLNSRLFNAIPGLSKSRLARLAWIQAFKRSPVNLRRLTGVKKEYNPKALGLFLSGYCTLYTMDPKQEYLEQIRFFVAKIEALKSRGWSGACWGYNFDWQARAFFQPKQTPTVVASVFIASALLDAYEITKEEGLLQTARSTCDFILKDLNRTTGEKGDFAFSYSPLDKSVVFNASLLGSRLLARVYSYTKELLLMEEAKKSVVFCCRYQQANGAWAYGTLPFHQWIDNFHTGYNLECIQDYMKYTGDHAFEAYVKKGYDYYIKTFFTAEGVPCYYSNSVYPVDVHAPAQMVVTVAKLGTYRQDKAVVDKVMHWTVKHMRSEKGYFYYQVNKHFSSKIPYMRWAQAWMFYALTTYLKLEKNEQNSSL